MNAQLKPRTEFQRESLRAIAGEVQDLLVEHYDEISETKHIAPLEPDWERYFCMEDSEHLLCLTVRSEGKLIGYFWACIENSLHYKSLVYGITDIYFIHKDHRKSGVGYRFFKYVIEVMKELGVDVFLCNHKIRHDHSRLFESLGFRENERHYMMILEK